MENGKMQLQGVRDFAEELASSSPVPGGGGASALVGALGIALGNMVGSLTVGKKAYADVEEEMRSLMARAQDLRLRLLDCIPKDAEAFEPLSRAYGIPKETPGRDEIMERCLRAAAEVPMEIAELCCEAIDLLERFARKGSRLMTSDAATGAAACRGALQGAAMNVKVNTRLMKDRVYAAELDARVEARLQEWGRKAETLFDDIYCGRLP